MKKLRVSALLGLFLASPAAFAQKGSLDVTVWAATMHSTSSTAADSQGTTVDLRDGAGCGLSVDVPLLSLLSVQVSGFELNPIGRIQYRGQPLLDLGRLKTYTVTGLLDVHPFGRSGDIDVRVGAGATWATFSDLSSADLDTAGIGNVSVKSKAGFAAAVGIRAAMSKNAGVALDVRYERLRPESKGSQGAPLDLEVDPLVVSVGLSWRF